jgi:type IV pilus assembly protein PilQ
MKISNIFIIAVFFIIISNFSCAHKISQLPEVQKESISEVSETEETFINEIKDVKETEDENSILITIEGEAPLSYKDLRLTNPLRIAVDIPNSKLRNDLTSLQVNNGIITSIEPIQMEENNKPKSRFEIGLEMPVDYDITSVDKKIFIDIDKRKKKLVKEIEEKLKKAEKPKKVEGKVAKEIKDIKVREEDGNTIINIYTDGIIKDYRAFSLLNPPRIVIDIPNVVSMYPSKTVKIETSHLKSIRIGRYFDKVRLVLDSKGRELPNYKIFKEKEGLIISLNIGKGVKESEEIAKITEGRKIAKEEEVGEKEEKIKEEEQEKKEKSKKREELLTRKEGKPQYTGRKVTLDFKDADIHNIFRLIAEVSNLNIIVDEDVKGKITLRLIEVPWDQALDIILESKNLGMSKIGNVIRIAPIKKIKAAEEARLTQKKAIEKLEELETKYIPVSYAKAEDLVPKVKNLLTDRGSVEIDERTNTIIINDIKKVIKKVERLVKYLDSETPQVLIEARIVEASTDFAREIGVQWGGRYVADAQHGNAPNFTFPNRIGISGATDIISNGSPATSSGSNFAVNLPAAVGPGAGGAIGLSFGSLNNSLQLDIRLSAMETAGKGRIISSPKVVTLDNKEAKIEQGVSIPYETTSAEGTKTEFVDAILSLKVTPHVTADKSIIMKIKATKNAPNTAVRSAAGAPSIDKKEAEAEVLVKNGQTTIIGGIFQKTQSETISGVPWFYKIPLIGWLFKNTKRENKKTELLIFITPRIITGSLT